MECPKCKLINPAGVIRCDCGYNFQTQTVETLPPVTPSGPAPAYKLFDRLSVYIASALGSPIVGAILIARNYSHLGQKSKARWAVILGIAGTIAAIPALYYLPQSLTLAGQLVLMLVTGGLAEYLQGAAIKEHVRHGGALASRWLAAGAGTIGLAVTGGLLLLGVYGQKLAVQTANVTIGTKDNIFYSGSATAADANALGQKLKDIGYFSDKGLSAEVFKDANGEAIGFMVKDGVWNQPDMVFGYERIALQAAPAVGGSPVRLRLENAMRQTQKEVTVGLANIGAQDQIAYFGTATEADAKALGQVLQAAGFFMDKGGLALLSKDNGTTVSLVVADGVWDKPDVVSALEKMIRDGAAAVGGPPIKMRLMDSSQYETKMEVSLD
jgi:hypothetical protein